MLRARTWRRGNLKRRKQRRKWIEWMGPVVTHAEGTHGMEVTDRKMWAGHGWLSPLLNTVAPRYVKVTADDGGKRLSSKYRVHE